MDREHAQSAKDWDHGGEDPSPGGDGADGGARWSRLLSMWIGRLGGPTAAIVVYIALGATTLDPAARATASVGSLMAIWWMTEAVPLPITSLLPVVLFPLLGIADIEAATRPFASDIIFLFGGGFALAAAVQRWNLHRRIALATVLAIGTEPQRLIGGFMVATAVVSMWVSNTATAVMMLPIGMSVVAMLLHQLDANGADEHARRQWRRFATALMLSIAYAASIGSIGTIIGTPPNGILAGYLADQGTPVGFGQWMLLGVPLAVVFLFIAWFTLTRVIFRMPTTPVAGGGEMLRAELAELGRLHRAERIILVVFAAAATAWILRPLLTALPGLDGISDASIAIAAAIVLFLAPVDLRAGTMVLDWESARTIPWDVLLLFGGGLSLAAAIRSTGLAAFIGHQLASLGVLRIGAVVFVVAIVIVLLTEITSNTATVAVFVPLLAGVAAVIGVDPLLLMVPATIVATFAFMLPVATPPNAIVFSSGVITVGQMARAGILLNVIGAALATAATFTLVPLVFGSG